MAEAPMLDRLTPLTQRSANTAQISAGFNPTTNRHSKISMGPVITTAPQIRITWSEMRGLGTWWILGLGELAHCDRAERPGQWGDVQIAFPFLLGRARLAP